MVSFHSCLVFHFDNEEKTAMNPIQKKDHQKKNQMCNYQYCHRHHHQTLRGCRCHVRLMGVCHSLSCWI